MAQRISGGELKAVAEIIAALRPIYTSDRAFKTDFSEISFDTKQTRNRRVVRYILTKLERQISGVELDPDAESINIEHVLPQNPSDEWNFSDAEAQGAIYRIGNMTLLRKDDNREINNSSYESKKPVFSDCDFSITSSIPKEYDDWNIDTVGARQSSLANTASGIWRISQFD